MLYDANLLIRELYEEFGGAQLDEDTDSNALHAMWSLEEMHSELNKMVTDRRAAHSSGMIADVYDYFVGQST
jgi:hypothetical protein